MSAPSADRNLLFGILAVQLDFVTKDALVATMNAWLLDKGKPLGEILRDRGHLPPDRLQLLTALVAEHLKQHGNDPQRSLAALSNADAVGHGLAGIADADVQASLGHVGARRRDPRGTIDAPPTSPQRYEILRQHARGGRGEVFVAEDTELHRPVALKEIQARFADDPESRARFVLEAEITGGLEHPGVVPVYGLGAYADGRPFYAMRFIKGDNLQQAIRRFHGHVANFDSLSFRRLLRRFTDVCNAVAYAHSRGVLHRDLKPGNVMLGSFGETLVVDWGLAKVTGRTGSADDRGEAADATLRPHSGGESSATVAGRALGTPAYMSPEQAAGRLDQLGPATDVYSLGATLYEVLTGRVPFPETDLDVVRKGLFLPPQTVQPGVPRPLNAVCLKAMALDAVDRYGSALDLAQEVEHWLADEPVTAYREPLGASLRRWVRKHARLVTGAVVALLVGVVGLAVGAGLLAAANERERLATAAERQARETASKRLEQIGRGVTILRSIFENLDPKAEEKEGKPLRAILGERLDQATAQLSGEAVGDPAAVANLQHTLGLSQLGLGYPEKAIELLAKARATFTAQLGPDHPDTLASMNNLAESYGAAGNPGAALALYEETLKLRKAKLGPDHPDTLQSMGNLAECYQSAGKLDAALPLYEETLKLMKVRLGPDHPDTLGTMNNLASGYGAAGKLDAALPLYEETLKRKKIKLGPDHPDTLTSMNNLAHGHQAAGNLGAALALYEETLKLRKAKLGPDHPDTLASMNNLAYSYQPAGKLDAALPLFEETLKLRKAKLGPDHPDTLASMNNLASGYRAAGKLDAALPLFEETLKLTTAKLGPDHPDTLQSRGNLAVAYTDAGNLGAALPLHEETLKLRKAKLGSDHPDTLESMGNLASGYRAAGKLDAALPLYEETLKLRKAKLGPDHPHTLVSMNNLAVGYRAAGKLDAALPLFEETLKLTTAKLGPDHPSTLLSMYNLAVSYQAARNQDAALPLFRDYLAGQRQRLGGETVRFAGVQSTVALDLLKAGHAAAAEPILRECLAVRERQEPDAWTTFNTLSMLGAALVGQQKHADAEPLLRQGFDGLQQRAAKIPPQSKPRLAEAAERLVKLYEATGKSDAAAAWRKTVESLAPPPTAAPLKP